ncbi:hypothetical protein [Neisseria sicca]|uniref:hypothetical protein n=1 Tax=Neisseria sicca TaxID=490 RepID=UPI0039656BF9
MFQHTAARRRLVFHTERDKSPHRVSTHSRPKAAGCKAAISFSLLSLFQHTAARRRLVCWSASCPILFVFQHTAARRRLGQ